MVRIGLGRERMEKSWRRQKGSWLTLGDSTDLMGLGKGTLTMVHLVGVSVRSYSHDYVNFVIFC